MKTLKSIKSKYYFLLALAAMSVAAPFSVYFSQQAAAKAVSDMSSTEQIQSYAYFNALSLCIQKSRLNTTISSNDDAPQWFKGGLNDPDITVGYFVDSQDAQRKCGNMITDALSLWGYTKDNFLKDLGYKLSGDGTTWDFGSSDIGKLKSAFQAAIKKKVYGGNNASMDDAARYSMVLGTYTMSSACGAKDLGLYDNQSATVKKEANSNAVNGGTGYTNVTILVNSVPEKHIFSVQNNNMGVAPYYADAGPTGDFEGICDVQSITTSGAETNMAKEISTLTNRIFDQLTAAAVASAQTSFAGLKAQYKAGCKAGGIPELTCSGKEGQWNADVVACVQSNFSKTGTAYESALASCMADKTDISVQLFIDAVAGLGATKDANTPAPIPPPGSNVIPSSTSSCAIDGIGWIVCPVMTFLGSISDQAYNFIAGSFLNIDVKLLSPTLPDGTVNPTYSTWGTFRNIANVLFVVVFLMIVFSQLTSVGISSYGVKKMLPRLVIAAILVNASYFIVQIAVDISNILGYSVKSLFETLPIYTKATTATGLQMVGQGLTWGVLVAGAIGVVTGIVLAISTPVLLASLLAALMTVLILIGRQAIIIILVIISPLAFVAWLLPNTEQLFKKWWKMFFSLLMVFPVIGVLFGASKMAATVMQAVGASSGDPLISVIAMGVATIPLILTPSLLKNSLKATGALGTKLSGLSSKANKEVGGKVKTTTRLGEFNTNRQANNLQNRANRRAKPGGLQNKLDSSGLGRRLGFDKGAARAVNIVNTAENDEVEQELQRTVRTTPPHDLPTQAKQNFLNAVRDGDTVKARANQKILSTQLGAPGIKTFSQALGEIDADTGGTYKNADGTYKSKEVMDTMTSLERDINATGLKGKDNITATRGYSGKTMQQIQDAPGTYSGLTVLELANQRIDVLQKGETANAWVENEKTHVKEWKEGISAAQANAVLHNEAAVSNMEADKRDFFTKIAKRPSTHP